MPKLSPMLLRKTHRALAIGLGAFLGLHLTNHALIVFGPEAHRAAQDVLRHVYRLPLIEPLLIFACVLQIAAGLKLATSRRWPLRFWPRAQLYSGMILAAFMTIHVSAALITRWSKPFIDTDVFWAAAVVSRPGWAAFFAPYYTLGVAALFTHLGALAALRRRLRLGRALLLFGFSLGLFIVAGLMGAFGDMTLPAPYARYLDTYFG